jgi:hypothetical protein
MPVQPVLRRAAAAVAVVALAAPAARAQNAAAVAQVPNTIEIGADAGATFGLGDVSSVNITLPAQRARVGFFLNNDSRVSIEPAVGFGYNKSEGQPGQTNYLLEAGALYHFRPRRLITDVANRAACRTPVRSSGSRACRSAAPAKNENEVFAGFGVGVKIPYRTNIALRAEANLGYGFDNDAARLGLNLGLSFFTRRAQ